MPVANPNIWIPNNKDLRKDGSRKGVGWLGVLPTKEIIDGKEYTGVMTEKSIGVNIDNKDIDIPAIVPGLSKDEVDHLAAGNFPHDEIIKKAVKHARMRMALGKSPYYEAPAFPVPDMNNLRSLNPVAAPFTHLRNVIY